jgi:hypothetical protein
MEVVTSRTSVKYGGHCKVSTKEMRSFNLTAPTRYIRTASTRMDLYYIGVATRHAFLTTNIV